MRVAIKFAYDGTRFHGYQRQPDVRTVEDDIIRSLRKATIATDVKGSKLQSGSRTDRGVSALGNVLAFDTDFDLDEIIPAHNAYARDVWFHSFAEVDDDFNPRFARSRWYRYHLRKRENVKTLKEVASVFVGEHDFASYTKDSRDTVRRIDSIEIGQEGDFTVIDVRGRGFLWQMVRRIVRAVECCERGDAELGTLRAALGGERLDLGVAPPEPLFLMDVEYGFEFQTEGRYLEDLRATMRDSLYSVDLRKMLFSRMAHICDS
ncbi:MAG: tRNA pseudouridine(38-40) synthase TruA [Candidatus Thermoplasmatota archaeon]|nr:tRNA pseudouridine(38-40) synthase TruA [Candidatus Thermoplasmatota archaeon]